MNTQFKMNPKAVSYITATVQNANLATLMIETYEVIATKAINDGFTPEQCHWIAMDIMKNHFANVCKEAAQ